MLEAGDIAPDFTLPDEQGAEVSLVESLERGPALLYFYPADFTPGCTAQACMFRDAHASLADAGITVLGISPQDSQSHRKFKDKFSLNFPLLADTDKAVIRAYGVAGPFGLITRRATYHVAPQRVIEQRLLADLRIDRHQAFVNRVLSQAAGL